MKKVISTVCVICILALSVGGLAAVSSGFQNWNVKTWFDRTEEAPTANPDDASGVLVANAVSSNRMALASTAAASDGSVTVTAKVKDKTGVANDSIQSVTWSLEWASTPADSSLAVSDCVTLTTNGTSATVKYKASFGTKINLKCTSTIDTSVSAVCVLDCLRRMSAIEYMHPSSPGVYNTIEYGNTSTIAQFYNFTYSMFTDWGSTQPKVTYVKSVSFAPYTVASNDPIECCVTPSSSFVSVFNRLNTVNSNYTMTTARVSLGEFANDGEPLKTDPADIMCKITNSNIDSSGTHWASAPFYNALVETSDQFSINIVYGDRAIMFTIDVQASVAVDSVELDNSSVTL